ncbi:uncharacterized protein DUF4276 [Prosthecobacter fusiformis]|uniref:Uncharacterized protein DUF4276 n=2 Tax=Prosthecobacter fusiformis TaxID=48464 RepID=A0A4R7RLH3_9BACT|nr:uncharacterized protein DUF4276 [Prosthecobacter fusiformis]
MPAIIRGGGRNQTFDAYKRALQIRKADELPLLLVDSEDLVAEGCDAWKHLKSRKADNWEKPPQAGDQDAYLMITCMETWFLADREALQKYFHDCWRDSAIPKWANLEEIPKESVFQALSKATADCGKKAYSKGKAAFDLLKAIDPSKVESVCPSAKKLLDRLRNK